MDRAAVRRRFSMETELRVAIEAEALTLAYQPLIELSSYGLQAVMPNTVTGSSGLAVSGAEFAFFKQHRSADGFHWEVHRAHRVGEAVVETGREHLVLPDGRRPSGWARGKIGRDGMLWLQVDGDRQRWYQYEIDV